MVEYSAQHSCGHTGNFALAGYPMNRGKGKLDYGYEIIMRRQQEHGEELCYKCKERMFKISMQEKELRIKK